MRPPEELDAVDWSDLEQAYGPADEVPVLLGALYTAEGDDFDEVFGELAACIFHQGSLYSATAAAVPFLAHAAVNLAANRDHALGFLVMLADEASRGAEPDEVAVRRAVETELPELLRRCLADAHTEVRLAAVRLAASAVGPAPSWVVEALELTYESDPLPQVRADALTALALLLPGESREGSRRAEALRSDWPEIRLAAALLEASLKDGLLRPAGRLGPLGTSLLGDLEKLLERSDLTGAAAADAHWRIAGDAEAVLPALTRLTTGRHADQPTLTAMRALSTLAEVGRLPEQLRSHMEEIAFSRRRVMSGGGPVELPHRDERMRRAASRLLGQRLVATGGR